MEALLLHCHLPRRRPQKGIASLKNLTSFRQRSHTKHVQQAVIAENLPIFSGLGLFRCIVDRGLRQISRLSNSDHIMKKNHIHAALSEDQIYYASCYNSVQPLVVSEKEKHPVQYIFEYA